MTKKQKPNKIKIKKNNNNSIRKNDPPNKHVDKVIKS